MSRRRRALGFAAAAALCAGLAASAIGGYRTDVEAQLGELRPALVTKAPLPARRVVAAKRLTELVEVRRVPARFVSPDTLSAPAQLAGRRPLAPIPAGSYLLASQLRLAGSSDGGPPKELERGRRPVEIAVDGAAALGAGAQGRHVDVIVTTEPGAGGAGRTYVAAESVVLLGLAASAGDPAGDDVIPGPPLDSQVATLALTREQALRLIQAESFARSVRLIVH